MRASSTSNGGIDFGVDGARNVVLFEANANMAIARPDPDPRWAYGHASDDTVVAAVRGMIVERSTSSRSATRSVGRDADPIAKRA
jgi:hypothetical protein